MSTQRSKYEIDMIHGGLPKKLLLFALPLIFSSVLQLLFNAIDVIVVGRYVSEHALGAVGATSALINLLVNLFIGLSVGANVVIAQDLGAGELKKVRKDTHTSIVLALIGGFLLTIIGVFFTGQFLVWMSTPADLLELASLYLRIYFFGMPANMLYNFGAAILRAQGDTKRPLYILTLAGVLNAGLNLFFILVCGMSVDGVALATIISQYLSAGLVIWCLMVDDGPLKLDLKALKMDGRTVLRILRVGLPAGLQGIVFSLSNVVIQSAINSFDNVAINAGSTASASIEGFIYVAMNAFYQTCLTFTSQNYSAGLTRRVTKTLLLCQFYVFLTGLILGNLATIFGHSLAAIYAPGKPEVIEQAVVRMRYACRFYFLCGMMDVFVGALRGLGYSITPMLISVVGACGVRILWVMTIFQTYHSTQMLFVSYPISWGITATAHLITFLIIRKRTYARANTPRPEDLEAAFPS